MIRLENISKSYKMDEVTINVLYNIDLRIRKGEFVSIAGPSGSGKSTILHLIGCLDRPTKGDVFIGNRKISGMDDNELAHIRGRKIGFVFQTFNLIPRLTALENVMLPMWFADGVDSRKAMLLLKEVGLSHRTNNKPGQLSGGERQRVAIARALANEPEIIVADEPTGNLDSKTGSDIIKILADIHETGRTLVLVTHDMKISAAAQRRIEMKDGMLVG